MSNNIKNRIDDALIAFYKEEDKDALADMLKGDVSDIDAYNKKKKQLIILAGTKAQKERNGNVLRLVSIGQKVDEENIDKPGAVIKHFTQSNPCLVMSRSLPKLPSEAMTEMTKDQNF